MNAILSEVCAFAQNLAGFLHLQVGAAVGRRLNVIRAADRLVDYFVVFSSLCRIHILSPCAMHVHTIFPRNIAKRPYRDIRRIFLRAGSGWFQMSLQFFLGR